MATNGEVAMRSQIDTGPDYCEHSQAFLNRYVGPCLSASTTPKVSVRRMPDQLVSLTAASCTSRVKSATISYYPKNIPSSRHSCEAHISILDADFTQPVTQEVSSADLRTYTYTPTLPRFQIRNISYRSTFPFAKARKILRPPTPLSHIGLHVAHRTTPASYYGLTAHHSFAPMIELGIIPSIFMYLATQATCGSSLCMLRKPSMRLSLLSPCSYCYSLSAFLSSLI